MRSAVFGTITSAAATLAAAGVLSAQTYSLSPGNSVSEEGSMDILKTLTIQITNASSDTLIFQWRKISAEVPLAWEAVVCDNFVCYDRLEDSGTMNPVLPSDYGFLLFHITPHLNYGTAVIRYLVWEQNDLSRKDTLTFILNSPPSSGENQFGLAQSSGVHPSPANDFIGLTTNQIHPQDFVITNQNGGICRKGTVDGNSASIAVRDLSSGYYHLLLRQENRWLNQPFLIQR